MKVNTSRPDSGSILIIQNNPSLYKRVYFIRSMTFNSMNHIHYCMYAYINLISKVRFHSITSNYESENNQIEKFRFHSIN